MGEEAAGRGRAPGQAPSRPVSRVLPAETLPAPELSVEPATPDPAAGARVQLRCRAPRAGLRFALVREDAGGRRALQLLSPAGPEATFELNDVSVLDSANYSCVYADRAPPFAGSAPSKALELRVRGERLPPPTAPRPVSPLGPRGASPAPRPRWAVPSAGSLSPSSSSAGS